MPAGEEENDPLEGVQGIPTVSETGFVLLTKPQPVKRKIEVEKADISWTLRPWSTKPKKAMVTMSDVGLNAKARGDGVPQRQKRRKPRVIEPEKGNTGLPGEHDRKRPGEDDRN